MQKYTCIGMQELAAKGYRGGLFDTGGFKPLQGRAVFEEMCLRKGKKKYPEGWMRMSEEKKVKQRSEQEEEVLQTLQQRFPCSLWRSRRKSMFVLKVYSL